MLIDFENTGFITVCSSPDIIPIEEKNTYIPTSTWGYIRGDISEQSDLMNLLANIEGGLTAEQISLLVNADIRLNEVEQDIIDLTAQHNTEITDITTALSTKADAADYYTKSEIDSRNYLTEHQSLAGYATENWVYSKGYLSTETDPIWSAEKHKYALKAELPSMVGYAKENWVSEQLTAKANLTDVYSKIEIDGKKYITESQLNTELLAKANLSDIYTKIEIDGKNFATKDWTATELLAYAKVSDVYTKTEMDDKEYITSEYLDEQLLSKANTGDVYTKIEIDDKEFINETRLTEELTAKANLTDVYTKIEIDDKEFINETRLTEELTAKANLTDVYTKIEIDGKDFAPKDWIATELLAYAKLSDVYTKIEIKDNLKTEGFITVDDLDGYATEDWVVSQGYLTEHQSLDNYYTKSEVDTAIENAEVDLTGYATETWVEQQEYVAKQQIWTGTEDEWDALSAEQQNSYIIAMIEL